MEIKIRWYKKQVSHARVTYLIGTNSNFAFGKFLAEAGSLEDVLRYGDVNNCVLKNADELK